MFSLSVNRSAFRVLLVAGVLLAGSILAMTMFNSALFAQDSAAIEYAENGTDPVATYTAVDPDGTAISSWTVGGTDAGAFTIEGGVLTFKKSPNYEAPGDIAGTGFHSCISTTCTKSRSMPWTAPARPGRNQ